MWINMMCTELAMSTPTIVVGRDLADMLITDSTNPMFMDFAVTAENLETAVNYARRIAGTDKRDLGGTMSPEKLVLAVHCHQPVGRSDENINEAYLKAYLPFVETLEKYPAIKLVAHYSGTLYEWFSKNHPEFLEKIKLLVKRGQMEVLTGGFYEPILPLTPYEDSLEQIKLETDFIKHNFF